MLRPHIPFSAARRPILMSGTMRVLYAMPFSLFRTPGSFGLWHVWVHQPGSQRRNLNTASGSFFEVVHLPPAVLACFNFDRGKGAPVLFPNLVSQRRGRHVCRYDVREIPDRVTPVTRLESTSQPWEGLDLLANGGIGAIAHGPRYSLG